VRDSCRDPLSSRQRFDSNPKLTLPPLRWVAEKNLLYDAASHTLHRPAYPRMGRRGRRDERADTVGARADAHSLPYGSGQDRRHFDEPTAKRPLPNDPDDLLTSSRESP